MYVVTFDITDGLMGVDLVTKRVVNSYQSNAVFAVHFTTKGGVHY